MKIKSTVHTLSRYCQFRVLRLSVHLLPGWQLVLTEERSSSHCCFPEMSLMLTLRRDQEAYSRA